MSLRRPSSRTALLGRSSAQKIAGPQAAAPPAGVVEYIFVSQFHTLNSLVRLDSSVVEFLLWAYNSECKRSWVQVPVQPFFWPLRCLVYLFFVFVDDAAPFLDFLRVEKGCEMHAVVDE